MVCYLCIQIKAKGVNMIYTFCQWLFFFYFYCFLGWIWETCYVSVLKGHWVNRGFMRGSLPSNLWLWSNYRADLYTAIQDECSSCFLYGNDQRNHTGICNWRGNGEAVPCQILGLQQSEIESEWTYLSYVVSGLGRLLCSS